MTSRRELKKLITYMSYEAVFNLEVLPDPSDAAQVEAAEAGIRRVLEKRYDLAAKINKPTNGMPRGEVKQYFRDIVDEFETCCHKEHEEISALCKTK